MFTARLRMSRRDETMSVNLDKLKELVGKGFEKELAAEALRRNENDTQKALNELTTSEGRIAIQAAIESRKRERQTAAMVEILRSERPRDLEMEDEIKDAIEMTNSPAYDTYDLVMTGLVLKEYFALLDSAETSGKAASSSSSSSH